MGWQPCFAFPVDNRGAMVPIDWSDVVYCGLQACSLLACALCHRLVWLMLLLAACAVEESIVHAHAETYSTHTLYKLVFDCMHT